VVQAKGVGSRREAEMKEGWCEGHSKGKAVVNRNQGRQRLGGGGRGLKGRIKKGRGDI
jgi:hypothetical protein